MDKISYEWIEFYSELANKLIQYKNNRLELIKIVQGIFANINMPMPKLESDGVLIDFDPFTFYSLFNKGLTDVNRIKIATEMAKQLGIKAAVPQSFEGIPVVNNQSATFYYFKNNRKKGEIDNLWNVFVAGLEYADTQSEDNKQNLIKAYDTVSKQKGVRWNITMGLYWIRPYDYINLDSRNRSFLSNDNNQTNMPKPFAKKMASLLKNPISGTQYVQLVAECKEILKQDNLGFKTFPELSYSAWKMYGGKSSSNQEDTKINLDKLENILMQYRKNFQKNWENEKYKWEAIKQFQDNWDIEADNFAGMIKTAMGKTFNLLASGYAYPRQMILNFAEVAPEETRQMFRNLYDETKDIAVRTQQFMDAAKQIQEKYGDGNWKNHYQNTNSISTYLWLRYPDKYYIYKSSIYRVVAAELDADYEIKENGKPESMAKGFAMYDAICNIILQDKELIDMFQDALTDDCYSDPYFKTLTIDVGYYLGKHYGEKPKTHQNQWFPVDYNPGITKQKWEELLNDSTVFTKSALQIMARLMDCGGEATCTQLANKYGETKNFYNVGGSSLAQRIAEKIDCEVMKTNDGKTKWWPIVFVGKNAGKDEAGSYIWKLRDELKEALKNTDLSYLPLYVDDAPAIWKISQGSDSTGVPDDKKKIFMQRNVVVVHGQTKPMGKSKVSQGEIFRNLIKKGDYFYLCYASSIQLLGQFTTEEAEPNQEMKDGWVERQYKTIAVSLDLSPYTGDSNWWAPNGNSTCIMIKKDEYKDFEERILQPYFNLKLNKDGIPYKSYSEADFLNEVYMKKEQYEDLVARLEHKKNVILQGAPGVGKTFAAKRLAYSIMGKVDDSQIEFIQFHQNYTYEDFIMGYRPDTNGGFKLNEGIFYRFCKKAEAQPNKKFFFIIDEINRGNLSKIFGELMMSIENEYRGKAKIKLAYRDELFSVPKNLYIIGMMNTADRSLAMIDYALRRRFSFFEMEPGFDSDGFTKYQKDLNNETFNKLIDQVKILNENIKNDRSLGKGFRIGHSHFCEMDKTANEQDQLKWMQAVVKYDILPTLEEYWFDEQITLDDWSKKLRGVVNDN